MPVNGLSANRLNRFWLFGQTPRCRGGESRWIWTLRFALARAFLSIASRCVMDYRVYGTTHNKQHSGSVNPVSLTLSLE